MNEISKSVFSQIYLLMKQEIAFNIQLSWPAVCKVVSVVQSASIRPLIERLVGPAHPGMVVYMLRAMKLHI